MCLCGVCSLMLLCSAFADSSTAVVAHLQLELLLGIIHLLATLDRLRAAYIYTTGFVSRLRFCTTVVQSRQIFVCIELFCACGPTRDTRSQHLPKQHVYLEQLVASQLSNMQERHQ